MRTERIRKPAKLPLSESTIFEGDSFSVLERLPDKSVQCIVTSPPYWGLRDYDIDDQIGLEPTLPQFISALRSTFKEARRVLKEDGILWLNIGDGYTSGNRRWRAPDKKNPARAMNVRPDTPEGLKRTHAPGRVLEVRGPGLSRALDGLNTEPGVLDVSRFGAGASVRVDPERLPAEALARLLRSRGVEPLEMEEAAPTLDDVFLALTSAAGRKE